MEQDLFQWYHPAEPLTINSNVSLDNELHFPEVGVVKVSTSQGVTGLSNPYMYGKVKMYVLNRW